MPIYEFRCGGCDHVYEVWTGQGAPGAPSCPRCAATERTRVPSRFAVALGPARSDRAPAAGGACGCAGHGPCGCRST